MVQILKQGKFTAILDGAARVFGRVGYRRAMMSDIAEDAGVALGTLYRYAQSKEELFELALRRELGQEPTVLWDTRFGGRGFDSSLLDFVRDELVGGELLPVLADALEAEIPTDPSDELEAVLAELYDAMVGLHRAIRMIDRSANDWPALAALYAEHVRKPVVEALSEYLASRCEAGSLRPPPDIQTAARYIVETCATFAMHRHFTPGGNYASDEVARATAIHFISLGFLPAKQVRGNCKEPF